MARIEKNNKITNNKDNKENLAWHPSFVQAMDGTFVDYRDVVKILSEVQLTSEPLSIDVLIFKQYREMQIENDIARIFRETNIFEYKSPTDYISVADFHKTVGYCNLYSAMYDMPYKNITMSLVSSRHPQKLIKYLRSDLDYKVNETYSGIYIVTGASLPVQIIELPRLSVNDNAILKYLSNKLTPEDYANMISITKPITSKINMDAYFHVIHEANPNALKGAAGMIPITQEWIDVIDEGGWGEKWVERGKALGIQEGIEKGVILGYKEGKMEAVINMIKAGIHDENIIMRVAGFDDISKARELIETHRGN